MAGLTRTVDPIVEPVSLDEAKRHLRRLDSYEDTTIQEYVTAARAWCEGYLGQSFVTQTWEYKLDKWPCGEVELPKGPVLAVSSVTYVASGSTATTLSSTAYIVSTGSNGRVAPAYGTSWPTTLKRPDAITITYQAGYGTSAASTDSAASAAAVPGTIKSAVKIYTGYLMQERDMNSTRPEAVVNLLDAASFGQYMHKTPDA